MEATPLLATPMASPAPVVELTTPEATEEPVEVVLSSAVSNTDIVVLDEQGQSVFGAIDQQVVAYQPGP